MSVSYRHSSNLPWNTASSEERRFHVIFVITMVSALVLALLITVIQLPEKERFKKQTIPPRLARLILEQKQLPPPPKPEPKKLVKEEPPKPKPEEKKPEVVEKKPEPVKKEPPKQVAEKKPSAEEARKKAASAGLLAFSDQLADLREEPVLKNVRGVQKITDQGTQGVVNQRSIITASASQGSGGINTAGLSRETGSQGLSSRSTTQMASKDITRGSQAASESSRSAKGQSRGGRTREEIQLVFDQNKGAVYALYNRALREDPTLRGKVVLELTISADGKVIDCKIVSSELNNPQLERKLVSRIKLFKFPSRDVDKAVVSYPIDFLPS